MVDLTASHASGITITDRQLLINGTPFLVLGGELHNSSASIAADLDSRWAGLKELGLNTALVPVSWELIEPAEGVFDFTTIDFVIEGARSNGLRVIPLWFGSWKNGLSSYRPAWVKRDSARFPLARRGDGSPVQVLSVFSDDNCEADARAFAALMAHIREIDQAKNTVIMVQVENEVGLLGSSRDHSDAALASYESAVDPAFYEYLQEHHVNVKPSVSSALATNRSDANWPKTFGDSLATDELFQALHYARYVDRVVVAGRSEYEIPYFVNTWLDSPDAVPASSTIVPFGGQIPGNYPSGGPLPQVADAWRWAAPNVSMLTPDIYAGDFGEWCRLYSEAGTGFFIPEMDKGARGVADLHVAIGSYGAIGVSPFGIDGNDDEYAREHKDLLATTYRALAAMSQQVLAAQSRNEIVGFVLTDQHRETRVRLGKYHLDVKRDRDDGTASLPDAWGLIAVGDDGAFIGTGSGFSVAFESAETELNAGLELVESGVYRDGEWIATQVLNGDETISGELWRFPFLKHLPDYAFGEAFPEARVLRATVYEY